MKDKLLIIRNQLKMGHRLSFAEAMLLQRAIDVFVCQAGNSPVIPDGWVACSERLPDETQPVITVSDGGVVQRTVYQFCEGVWSDWYEQYDDVTADAFTHWMPLPAAPQEVKGE